jgi:hypothetical protein
MGLSVPTKASMKEIPPSISNAQKMGATLNARLKSSDKKRNHTPPHPFQDFEDFLYQYHFCMGLLN